jgi:hypothetical protein
LNSALANSLWDPFLTKHFPLKKWLVERCGSRYRPIQTPTPEKKKKKRWDSGHWKEEVKTEKTEQLALFASPFRC